MPRRRNDNRGLAGRSARLAASLLWFLWARAVRRPVDAFAIFAAFAASLVIIVNAVALQSGVRPGASPVNAPVSPAPASAVHPRLAEPSLIRSAELPRAQTVAARASDPIGQLIDMSSRIMGVQRALTAYGYGQIKPTGVLDQPTSTAIERFEREHKLPVTGKISDRLVSELSAMVGHRLD